jgi:2-iminoacetate synthase ThiH
MKIGHTGGLYGVATKMAYKKSNNIGIIMFTNAAIENLRDNFAFSMIEQLLYLKGAGLETTQFIPGELLETMLFNKVILQDFHLNDFPTSDHPNFR